MNNDEMQELQRIIDSKTSTEAEEQWAVETLLLYANPDQVEWTEHEIAHFKKLVRNIDGPTDCIESDRQVESRSHCSIACWNEQTKTWTCNHGVTYVTIVETCTCGTGRGANHKHIEDRRVQSIKDWENSPSFHDPFGRK